jgi:beta-lactam-binding protein with PASTA domain
MPDLTGMTFISAQAALQHAGLKLAPPAFVDIHVPAVGNGTAPPRLPVPPGAVMAQQPPAGIRVDEGTQVKLTVAK